MLRYTMLFSIIVLFKIVFCEMRDLTALIAIFVPQNSTSEYGSFKTEILHSLSLHNKLLVCNLCNVSCLIGGPIPRLSSYTARFLRVEWIRQLLQAEKYDTIAYMDMDAFVKIPSCVFFSLLSHSPRIPEKLPFTESVRSTYKVETFIGWFFNHLFSFLLPQRLTSLGESLVQHHPYSLALALDWNQNADRYQSGVMLIQNSITSRRIFDKLWALRGKQLVRSSVEDDPLWIWRKELIEQSRLRRRSKTSNHILSSRIEIKQTRYDVVQSTSRQIAEDMEGERHSSSTRNLRDTRSVTGEARVTTETGKADLTNALFTSDQLALNSILQQSHIQPHVAKLSRVRYNAFPHMMEPLWSQLGLAQGDEVAESVIVHFAGVFGGASLETGRPDILVSLISVLEATKRHLQLVSCLQAAACLALRYHHQSLKIRTREGSREKVIKRVGVRKRDSEKRKTVSEGGEKGRGATEAPARVRERTAKGNEAPRRVSELLTKGDEAPRRVGEPLTKGVEGTASASGGRRRVSVSTVDDSQRLISISAASSSQAGVNAYQNESCTRISVSKLFRSLQGACPNWSEILRHLRPQRRVSNAPKAPMNKDSTHVRGMKGEKEGGTTKKKGEIEGDETEKRGRNLMNAKDGIEGNFDTGSLGSHKTNYSQLDPKISQKISKARLRDHPQENIRRRAISSEEASQEKFLRRTFPDYLGTPPGVLELDPAMDLLQGMVSMLDDCVKTVFAKFDESEAERDAISCLRIVWTRSKLLLEPESSGPK